MRCCRLALTCAGVVVGTAHAAAVAQRTEAPDAIWVISHNPPAVHRVELRGHKISSSIAMPDLPLYGILCEDGQRMFVLHGTGHLEGLGLQDRLSVVDLQRGTVVTEETLGRSTAVMLPTPDGRSVIALSPGVDPRSDPSLSGEAVAINTEAGAITIFDTRGKEPARKLTTGFPFSRLSFTRDLRRFFVVDIRKEAGPRMREAWLTAFDVRADQPGPGIRLGDPANIKSMVLSGDDRWLYILEKGTPSRKPDKHKNGAMRVFDTTTLEPSPPIDAGADPVQVQSLSGTGEVVLLTHSGLDANAPGKVCQIDGPRIARCDETGKKPSAVFAVTGTPASLVVSEREVRWLASGKPLSTPLMARGPRWPGRMRDKPWWIAKNAPIADAIYVAERDHLLVMVLPSRDIPTFSVLAWISVSGQSVEQGSILGRAGVGLARAFGAGATNSPRSSLDFIGARLPDYLRRELWREWVLLQSGGRAQPSRSSPNLVFHPNGKFAYALSQFTSDVSILNLETGDLLKQKVAVGGARSVRLAPGNRFVYSYSPGRFDLIDTETNQSAVEQKTQPKSVVHGVYPIERRNELWVLTSSGIEIWDSLEGKKAAEIKGLGEPVFVVARTAVPSDKP